MNNDDLKSLYDNLIKKGYKEQDLGDYATFSQKMADKGNRKELYDYVSGRGDFRIGDYEAYESRLAGTASPVSDPASETVTAPVPVASPTPQVNEETKRQIIANKPQMFRRDTRSLLDRGSGVRRETPHAGEDWVAQYNSLAEDIAQRADYVYNQNADYITRRNALSQLDQLTKAVDTELAKPREAAPAPAGAAFIPATAYGAAQRYGNTRTREQQDRYTTLVAAKNFLDDARKIVDEAGKKGNTNFVAGSLRGLRDKVFDPDTWMMGISETSYYNLLRQAAEKEERGETLNPEEQQLLDAAAVNMAVNAYYSSDLGRGYKAGAVTGESIPFMLQFALNPVSAAGKGIAKSILKHGIRRFGLNTAKRTLTGRAVRGVARVAGDAVAAAGVTATTGLGNVAGDAARRMTGDVKFTQDDKGNIQYAGRENAMGTGEAIARAFASQFFENQSEMAGNYFGPVMRAISGQMKRLPGIKQLSASKAGEIYRGIKNNPTYKEFTDRTQWHGAIGEYFEEVYNNLASVVMGDMTLEELVDLDNNIDTFLGVGLMSAAFGGIGAAGFARDRYTLNRDMKRFEATLSPDEMEHWNEVKRVAQNGDVEGVREFVKYTMRDKSLTPQEKKDKIKYIFDVMRQAANENVASEQAEEAVQTETEDIASHSDPSTNMYTEAERIYMNEVGEMVKESGYIVGWQDPEKERFPYWLPEGAEFTPENIKLLRPGEWDVNYCQVHAHARGH